MFFYVLLDGFDLGVGILYGFAPRHCAARNLMMNSIAPIWDGNETWLVLGGLGLLAAFPLAFAIIIPAVYFPILFMLLALIFRGVAFEFRFRDAAHRTSGSRLRLRIVDRDIRAGHCARSFIQGFGRGPVLRRRQSSSCFTPFSVLTGVGLIFGYGLLGAGWLVLKTEGELQSWARGAARQRCVGVIAAVVMVSIWTPIMQRRISRALVRLAEHRAAFAGAAHHRCDRLSGVGARSNAANPSTAPFVAAIGLFVMSYLGSPSACGR